MKKPGHHYHIAVTKEYLVESIRNHGAKNMLTIDGKPFDGTDEEAIEMVLEDEREFFSGCENQKPNGECAGHPIEQQLEKDPKCEK